jgi:hypothetical protein
MTTGVCSRPLPGSTSGAFLASVARLGAAVASLTVRVANNHTLRIGEQLGTATSDRRTAAITVSVDSTLIRSHPGVTRGA